MRLRRNEFCPIHKSFSCCGRVLAVPACKDGEQGPIGDVAPGP